MFNFSDQIVVTAMTLNMTTSAPPASSLVLMSTSRASPTEWSGQRAGWQPVKSQAQTPA